MNVGAVETGFHSGTHTDAVFHFDPKGQTIERADLSTFIGPAIVADVTNLATVEVSHLDRWEESCAMRRGLLLKTGGWPNDKIFPKEFR